MKGLATIVFILISVVVYAQDSMVCRCTTYLKDTVRITDTIRDSVPVTDSVHVTITDTLRDTLRITDTVNETVTDTNRNTVTLTDTVYVTVRDTVVIWDTVTKENTGNIVFFGSSTIANWNLTAAFPGYPVKKIGYGGRTWAELLPLADSIKKLNPKQVVIYSGDNDVIKRKVVSTMTIDIENLISKIWAQNDSVPVVFLYTKPSDTAFKIFYPDGMQGVRAIEYTNRNVANWGSTRPSKFKAIDTYTINLLWDPKRLNTQLYNSDLLHMNSSGYSQWNGVVRPVLKTE